MHAARSSPSSAGERSVATLIVVAPSPSSARAVAGFAHGSSTDVLRTSEARELAAPPQLAELAQYAQVGDEERADAEREAAPHLGDRVVDAGATARHAAGRGRHE